MNSTTRRAVLAAGAAAALVPKAQGETLYDFDMAIGVDMSGTMQGDDPTIIRDGLVAAVRSDRFARLLSEMRRGRGLVSVFTWSAHRTPTVIVPRVVVRAETTNALAEAIAASPIGTGSGSTDLSRAVLWGTDWLLASPHWAERRLLNICGDGADNVQDGQGGGWDTPGTEAAVARAHSVGVEINGLSIGSDMAKTFYQRYVRTPNGSAVHAPDIAHFADALISKFEIELA